MIENPEWESAKYAVCYMRNGNVVQNGDEIRFNKKPPENLKDYQAVMAFALKHAIPRYIEAEKNV